MQGYVGFVLFMFKILVMKLESSCEIGICSAGKVTALFTSLAGGSRFTPNSLSREQKMQSRDNMEGEYIGKKCIKKKHKAPM
jgi:hypothetical protein